MPGCPRCSQLPDLEELDRCSGSKQSGFFSDRNLRPNPSSIPFNAQKRIPIPCCPSIGRVLQGLGVESIVGTRAFSKFLVGFLALTHGARSLGRRAKNSDPRRILVVHHLLLGDTLMLNPLLSKLRQRFPRA